MTAIGVESQKRRAAEGALALVKEGMALGLGTGSTVRYFLEGLGDMVEKGFDVKGVPTSTATADLARSEERRVGKECRL